MNDEFKLLACFSSCVRPVETIGRNEFSLRDRWESRPLALESNRELACASTPRSATPFASRELPAAREIIQTMETFFFLSLASQRRKSLRSVIAIVAVVVVVMTA